MRPQTLVTVNKLKCQLWYTLIVYHNLYHNTMWVHFRLMTRLRVHRWRMYHNGVVHGELRSRARAHAGNGARGAERPGSI